MLPILPLRTLFQQHRALLHYNHEVRELSNENQPDSWIEKGGQTKLPARFPDLTRLVFTCGNVKNKVYSTSATDATQLKRLIAFTICRVSAHFLQKVWKPMMKD